MKKQENNQDMESTKKSFLSMGFSLALVICVLLFIFGFKHFLKGREYQGNAVQKEAESSTQDIHKELEEKISKFFFYISFCIQKFVDTKH